MRKKTKQGEIDMNELTVRADTVIKELGAVVATFTPDKMTDEQRAQAVQFAVLKDTADKIITASKLAGIDWQSEKAVFLTHAGKTNSAKTRQAYGTGITRLETWAARQGINPLELTPAQADDFIYSLQGRAAASVRLDIAAVSSFYTWLHRRHKAIENIIRGTEARPAKKAEKKIEMPTAGEVELIIRELPAKLAAAAAVMAYRGLRAGALPTLTIAGEKFTGYSKGKDIKGKLPTAALEKIKAAALPLRGPFAGIKANTLEQQILRAIKKLHKAGKLAAAYSCHDLRHFYAVTEYKVNRDIYRVSKLLHHASLQITENYLRGLGEIE